MITRDDVLAASDRIAGYVRRTPVVEARPGLWLKCEFLQHTGTFKARGAFNRVLAARAAGTLDPAAGVVTASGGNAGLANAYAARAAGVPATVVVPVTAPAVKIARLREYGATVVLQGSRYQEAYEAAVRLCAERGALFSHAYDQPEIAAGAGTIGTELLADLPAVDTIIVAVGGGGLFAGVAAAVEGRSRVVAVEPEGAPTLNAALAAGGPVDVSVAGVASDSLGASRLGAIGWAVAARTDPVSVLVGDEAIVRARHELWSSYRIAAEHGAAAAYAALTSGAYTPAEGERVAVVVCGANTDPATL